MKRHYHENYYVVGEGILGYDDKRRPVCYRPSTTESLRKFRFSRLGAQGQQVDVGLLAALATAMTVDVPNPDVDADPRPDAKTPAGYTYLSQFVDHDLTKDVTAVDFGEDVSVAELVQGRSPSLDLDSLYGRGPGHVVDSKFYQPDGVKLKTAKTGKTPFPDSGTDVEFDDSDLPRAGVGSDAAARRAPLIPDGRNDENLAVAQTHLAFINFHNAVVDRLAPTTPSSLLFEKAKETVVRHYQWVLKTDLLPRIVDPAIVADVFTNGRRFFEISPPGDGGYDNRGDYPTYSQPGDYPTMPIEFSVAAYRLGHSMIRGAYQWNRVFRKDGPAGGAATLLQLFTFTGVSGVFQPIPNGQGVEVLDDPEFGDVLKLPTNWIPDFQRLYDFQNDAGRPDLVSADGKPNVTKRIDTLLVNPLATLPAGAFNGRRTNPSPEMRNLAFRNLVRANMVSLASGQQMAEKFDVKPLSDEEILVGNRGADLSGLTEAQKQTLIEHTPLWFYILREAELNEGRLGAVGGRIVAEVFHRAIEGSKISILRDPSWLPDLAQVGSSRFTMADLLVVAYQGKKELLNKLGDEAPAPILAPRPVPNP